MKEQIRCHNSKNNQGFHICFKYIKRGSRKKHFLFGKKENNGQITEQTAQSRWSEFFQTMASMLLLLSR